MRTTNRTALRGTEVLIIMFLIIISRMSAIWCDCQPEIAISPLALKSDASFSRFYD